jgi:2Fe-2S ferredoxin
MTRVRFLAHGHAFEVEVPLGTTLLEASKRCGAPEGDACGGVCACSTCHVYVTQGRDLLSEADEDEEDILDKAFDVRIHSRLGCQARVEGEGVVECTITRESLDAYYNEHPQAKDPRKA